MDRAVFVVTALCPSWLSRLPVALHNIVDAGVLRINHLDDRPQEPGATNMLDVDLAVPRHSAAKGVSFSLVTGERDVARSNKNCHDSLLNSTTLHLERITKTWQNTAI